MIVRDEFVISGIVSQMNHYSKTVSSITQKISRKKKLSIWQHRYWIHFQRLTYEVTGNRLGSSIIQLGVLKVSLAVITDSSVNLPTEIQGHADVYILDIPVIVEEQPLLKERTWM